MTSIRYGRVLQSAKIGGGTTAARPLVLINFKNCWSAQVSLEPHSLCRSRMCHWNTAVLERTVFPFNSSHPQPPGVFRLCLCSFVCWSVFVTAIVLPYLKLLDSSDTHLAVFRVWVDGGRYMTAGLPDWSETCWLAIRPFSKWDCKVLWFTLSSGL